VALPPTVDWSGLAAIVRVDAVVGLARFLDVEVVVGMAAVFDAIAGARLTNAIGDVGRRPGPGTLGVLGSGDSPGSVQSGLVAWGWPLVTVMVQVPRWMAR
jgi:hypothetical protein